MSWASSEVVNILAFLLPGFVAAAIFHSLTSHPKPNETDRIIQSLIFTIAVQAVAEVSLLVGRLISFEPQWKNDLEILFSVIIAVALAMVAAFVSNHDTLHSILRRLQITKETSYPSEWYSAFYRNSDCYVVLHLKGQRRLYGWPEEWPSRPDQGHFRIADGEWLVDEERRPAAGVVAIVIPASEVEMVEFLRIETEKELVLEDGQSTDTSSE